MKKYGEDICHEVVGELGLAMLRAVMIRTDVMEGGHSLLLEMMKQSGITACWQEGKSLYCSVMDGINVKAEFDPVQNEWVVLKAADVDPGVCERYLRFITASSEEGVWLSNKLQSELEKEGFVLKRTVYNHLGFCFILGYNGVLCDGEITFPINCKLQPMFEITRWSA